MQCANCGRQISGQADYQVEGKPFCSESCMTDHQRDNRRMSEPQT